MIRAGSLVQCCLVRVHSVYGHGSSLLCLLVLHRVERELEPEEVEAHAQGLG